MIRSQPLHCIRIGRRSEVTDSRFGIVDKRLLGKFSTTICGFEEEPFAFLVFGEITAVAHHTKTMPPLDPQDVNRFKGKEMQ